MGNGLRPRVKGRVVPLGSEMRIFPPLRHSPYVVQRAGVLSWGMRFIVSLFTATYTKRGCHSFIRIPLTLSPTHVLDGSSAPHRHSTRTGWYYPHHTPGIWLRLDFPITVTHPDILYTTNCIVNLHLCTVRRFKSNQAKISLLRLKFQRRI